jgi:hypothetical protein
VGRTREKAKGRRGGESEPFALLPKSVMEHDALATASHPAFRMLAILVVGKAKERNGLLECTQAKAAQFGLRSHDTRERVLAELTDRRLIVTTRNVRPFQRFPRHFAVTWWPIYFRDAQPLTIPEPPTHAYREWTDPRPAGNRTRKFPKPAQRGTVSPPSGEQKALHQPDLTPISGFHQPAQRGASKNLTGTDTERREARAAELLASQPDWSDQEIARITKLEMARVSHLRQQRPSAAEETT